MARDCGDMVGDGIRETAMKIFELITLQMQQKMARIKMNLISPPYIYKYIKLCRNPAYYPLYIRAVVRRLNGNICDLSKRIDLIKI